jgi:hypothetical protein
MCFNMGGVDHLSVDAASSTCELAEKIFPDSAPGPANKAIIDGRGRPIGFWTIAPTASTLDNMYYTADDTAVIYSFNASNIARKMRLYTSPLLIAEPKQISAHDLCPPEENHLPIGNHHR